MSLRISQQLLAGFVLAGVMSAGLVVLAKDKEKDKPAQAGSARAARSDSNSNRGNQGAAKEAPRQRVESTPRAERRSDNNPPANNRSNQPAKPDRDSPKRDDTRRESQANQDRNSNPRSVQVRSVDSRPAVSSREDRKVDRNKSEATQQQQQREARTNQRDRQPEGQRVPQLGVTPSGGPLQSNLNSRTKAEHKPTVRNEPTDRRSDSAPKLETVRGTVSRPEGANLALAGKNGSHDRMTPLKIEKNGHVPKRDAKPDAPLVHSEAHERIAKLHQASDHKEFERQLREFKSMPDARLHSHSAGLKVDRISGVYQQRIERHDFRHLHDSDAGRRLNLDRQFQLHRHGDLARQMNLGVSLHQAGGWQHRHHGTVIPTYTRSSFSVWYAGGGYYPRYCWTPRWTPWVDWCWWDTCQPIYDPRPRYCRPIVHAPCSRWVVYEYPVWQPLPVVTCGTWVDLPPVVVDSGTDLQLLATRFVDNGHPDQNLGPRYRVWLRNSGPLPTAVQFNVVLLAANGPVPTDDLPQAGAVVNGIEAGEIKTVDLRLPLAANRLSATPEGQRIPFEYLHVLIDSHRELVEANEANNGAVVARNDILSVDPAAFATDVSAGTPGTVINVAGEGFGPEPGQVIVSINGLQLQAEIHGWYDLGVRLALPNLTVAGPTEADILIVRGDGAAANPLDIDLVPPTMLSESPLPPVPSP